MGFRNNNFNYSVENVSVQCSIKSLKVRCCKHRKAVFVHGCGTAAPQDIHILAPRTRRDYPPGRKHFADMIKLRFLGGKDGSGFSGWAQCYVKGLFRSEAGGPKSAQFEKGGLWVVVYR